MNRTQQRGYDLAVGVVKYLVNLIGFILLILFLLCLAKNLFDWDLDDSDFNGWNRSGLRVHKDAKTGIEYLSDGKGGLTRRFSADGE